MNKSEEEFLYQNKLKMGKLPLQAAQEIKDTKSFVKTIKYDNMSLSRELQKAYETIKELELKVKELEPSKNDTFKKEFAALQKANPMDHTHAAPKFATTKVLTRIMSILVLGEELCTTKLSEDCMVEKDIIKDGLMFLLRNKFVKERYVQGIYVYSKI